MSASSTPRDISPNSNSTFLGRRKSGRKWKETAQRSSARIISRGDKRSFHSWTVKAQKRQEASFRKQAKAERKAQLDQLQQVRTDGHLPVILFRKWAKRQRPVVRGDRRMSERVRLSKR